MSLREEIERVVGTSVNVKSPYGRTLVASLIELARNAANEQYLNDAARTDIPDYRVVANRTDDDTNAMVLHAAMGISTEAGEIMDAVKRHLIYGKPLDFVNLQEEVGDLFWYAALLARACGFTFDEAMERNIAKLRARYPEKFTEHAALNRDLGQERRVLEMAKDAGPGTVTHDDRQQCPKCGMVVKLQENKAMGLSQWLDYETENTHVCPGDR